MIILYSCIFEVQIPNDTNIGFPKKIFCGLLNVTLKECYLNGHPVIINIVKVKLNDGYLLKSIITEVKIRRYLFKVSNKDLRGPCSNVFTFNFE